MKSLDERAANIAIVSTGDPEKDQQQLRLAALHQSRIDENICPNGCGPLTWKDPYEGECPVCHFVLFTNTPHGGKAREA